MKYAILFVLLCMSANGDEMFLSIAKYFYNADIQTIITKKRCKDNQ